MIREGQYVGWLWKRQVYVCLVRRWTGRDDDLVQLVTEKCLISGGQNREDATAYTFFDHLIEPDWVNRYGDIILPKEHADAVGSQILAFLQTKKGKAMMARPAKTKDTEPPRSGLGQPQRSEIGLKLAKGFTSNLSHSLESRITDGGIRSWSLAELRRENEVMANVFEDREKHGYSFKEIAIRRNLTENNARQIHFRAKSAIRILAGSYPVRMRLEAKEAEAA